MKLTGLSSETENTLDPIWLLGVRDLELGGLASSPLHPGVFMRINDARDGLKWLNFSQRLIKSHFLCVFL